MVLFVSMALYEAKALSAGSAGVEASALQRTVLLYASTDAPAETTCAALQMHHRLMFCLLRRPQMGRSPASSAHCDKGAIGAVKMPSLAWAKPGGCKLSATLQPPEQKPHSKLRFQSHIPIMRRCSTHPPVGGTLMLLGVAQEGNCVYSSQEAGEVRSSTKDPRQCTCRRPIWHGHRQQQRMLWGEASSVPCPQNTGLPAVAEAPMAGVGPFQLWKVS